MSSLTSGHCMDIVVFHVPLNILHEEDKEWIFFKLKDLFPPLAAGPHPSVPR